MTEISQSLKNRVYYAARDGMAVTLCALLSDKSEEVVKELLNQVSFLYIFVFLSFLVTCLRRHAS